MEDSQKITFTEEGDQEPGLEPGDIIIVLDEKQHEVRYIKSGGFFRNTQPIKIFNKTQGLRRFRPKYS